MTKKRRRQHSPEQVVKKLRDAHTLLTRIWSGFR